MPMWRLGNDRLLCEGHGAEGDRDGFIVRRTHAEEGSADCAWCGTPETDGTPA